MNELQVAIRAINRHGLDLEYTSVVTGVYNRDTARTENTRTTSTLKMYPRHVVADQYKLPTLIGKEVIVFYLANNALTFIPKPNDEIAYNAKTYKVVSFQEHFASGAVALYRITAVKG
jgi:uncharacterized protein YdhG (YjbR/CyaY superfamily)